MGYRNTFLAITFGMVAVLVFNYYEVRIHYGIKMAMLSTLALYLVVPFLVHLSPYVQRHLVFLPFVRWPTGIDFNKPSEIGVHGGRNLYLETEPGFRVGVWHLLPRCLISGAEEQGEDYWDRQLRDSGKPVMIYCHGNSGSRAGEHRRELYSLLQDLDYHVVCFDYRGYADSTECSQSETGVVTDARAVYEWVRKELGTGSKVPIFIWGHSLGTGVSTHFVADLCNEGHPPAGLILESPFTSLGEEIRYHMLSAMFRILPYFDFIFIKPLKSTDIMFESDRHIKSITVPIVILHALDDPVIPFFLAQKLFKIGYKHRPAAAKPIYFKPFGEGYAHKFICRSPDLPDMIKDFVSCSISNSWPCRSLEATTTPLINDCENL